MQNNTVQQPLWKSLNEQRALCTLEVDTNEDSGETVVRDVSGGRIIANFECDRYGLTDEEIAANAAYTALAVNNLHLLAEALEKVTQQLTVFSDMDVTNKVPMNAAIKQATEAINRIS